MCNLGSLGASGAVVAGSAGDYSPVTSSGPDGFSNDSFLNESKDNDDLSEITAQGEQKRVMCLMSDTGGGHRASATALRDGFATLYGDKFDINVVDLWTTHSPWPMCNMPKVRTPRHKILLAFPCVFATSVSSFSTHHVRDSSSSPYEERAQYIRPTVCHTKY